VVKKTTTKKKEPEVISDDLVKALQPDIRRCLKMYDEVLTILYGNPKTKLIEIEMVMDMVTAKIIQDKTAVALNRLISNLQEVFPVSRQQTAEDEVSQHIPITKAPDKLYQ
jgi:hypothetical protein